MLILTLSIQIWAWLEHDGFSETPKEMEVDCRNPSCAVYNESWPVYGPQSLDNCIDAGKLPFDNYTRENGFLGLDDAQDVSICRRQVCDMYNSLIFTMRPNQSEEGYYDGCAMFADFNGTMCPGYPDVTGYCDCLWFARDTFPGDKTVTAEQRECWEPITKYLLFGRFLRTHSDIGTNEKFIREIMPLNKCITIMCSWFSLLGTPFEDENIDEMYKYPDTCGLLALPTNVEQCIVIQHHLPYHPCPWKEEPRNVDANPATMYCFKEDNCEPDASSFSCCYPEGRMKCPYNQTLCLFPRNCAGNTDHCCLDECEEKTCSPMLVPWLAEWHGTVDADAPLAGNYTWYVQEEEEVTTKPTTLETLGSFKTLWIVVIVGSVVLLVVVMFVLWQFVFNGLRRHDQKISRPLHHLHLFGFTTFAANIGRKVTRSVFNLPRGKRHYEPEGGLPHNQVMLFNKDMRKIAPATEFGAHKGLPTQLERRVGRELDVLEQKKAAIYDKMKTNFDPDFQKKQENAQKKTDKALELRLAEAENGSLELAAELYNELNHPKPGDASPSRRLRNDAVAATTKIINETDHPAEKLTLDRLEGTLKVCPSGVTRLTGWLDEDGGSIFVGDAGTEAALPVSAPKPVCKYFQTGKCKNSKCPWLHAKARPGDRLREPVGPKR